MGIFSFLFNKRKKNEQKKEKNSIVVEQEKNDENYEKNKQNIETSGDFTKNENTKSSHVIENNIEESTYSLTTEPEECTYNIVHNQNFESLYNETEITKNEIILSNEQKMEERRKEHSKRMEQLRIQNMLKEKNKEEKLILFEEKFLNYQREQLKLEEQERKEKQLKLEETRLYEHQRNMELKKRYEEQLKIKEQKRKEERLKLDEQTRKEEELKLEEQKRKEKQLKIEEQEKMHEQLRLQEQSRIEERNKLEEQRRKEVQLRFIEQKGKQERIKNEKQRINEELLNVNNEIEEQIMQAKKNCIEIMYDGQKNEIIINSIDKNYYYSVIFRKLQIIRNDGKSKEEQIRKETKIYSSTDIGIHIFYNKDDIDKHKKLVIDDVRYKDNYNNIYEYFSSKFNSYNKEVQEDQPAGIVLTSELKNKIVNSYYDYDKNMEEESTFHSQISGCFGRIDLDTEYYREKYEEYYNKKHFYDKVYLSKGRYKKYKDTHIVNWRSPIASMYYDNENTTLTRKNDVDIIREYVTDNPNNVYIHELMLKRSYNFSPLKYNDLYISGDAFYFDGSADSFLLDIVKENRSNHKITDIIKTIQSNQNQMIRHDVKNNMIVQGCAGSGKTMILLHRVSYLLFNSLLPNLSEVKIITPNRAFSTFIKDLAMSLELESIERITMFDYYISLAKRYQEMYSTMQLKNNEGKIANKTEVDTNNNAIKYYNEHNELFTEETNIDETVITSYYKDEMFNYIENVYNEMVNTLKDNTHAEKVIRIAERFGLNKNKSLIDGSKQYFDYIYELCRSEIKYQNSNKENELKEIIGKIKKIQNKESNSINLFEEVIALEELLGKQKNIKNILLTEEEKSVLQEVFNILQTRGNFVLKIFENISGDFRNKNNIKSSAKIYGKHELIILVYLYFLHCGRLNSADQFLFIDEGQDYSLQEYRLLQFVNGNTCKFDVFGDVNQLLSKNIGINRWNKLKDILYADFYELSENYRNTIEITEFVNNEFNFNFTAIGIHGQEVKHINLTYLQEAIENEHIKDKYSRIAFVGCKIEDIKIPEYVNVYHNVKDVKGLEFDVVFVFAKNMSENEEYISLTRALNSLYIVNFDNKENKLNNSQSESKNIIIGNEDYNKGDYFTDFLDFNNLFENNIVSMESLIHIKKEQENSIRKVLEQRGCLC